MEKQPEGIAPAAQLEGFTDRPPPRLALPALPGPEVTAGGGLVLRAFLHIAGLAVAHAVCFPVFALVGDRPPAPAGAPSAGRPSPTRPSASSARSTPSTTAAPACPCGRTPAAPPIAGASPAGGRRPRASNGRAACIDYSAARRW